MAIEDYLGDRRKYIFRLLDEIERYPAIIHKCLLNYNLNYDDEQEMFSRDIIHMYRTGATDPNVLLRGLMNEYMENPSSDEDDELNEYIKERRS